MKRRIKNRENGKAKRGKGDNKRRFCGKEEMRMGRGREIVRLR